MVRLFLSLLSFSLLALTPSAFALDEAGAKALIAEKMNSWALDPTLIDAVKAQNMETNGYDQTKIDELDKKWKDSDFSTIDKVMKSKLSDYLRGVVTRSDDLFTEIIVMDAKGLNVGISDKSSDYWQGDEDKFTKTFGVGPDAIHLGKVELDDSTQMSQQQISFTLVHDGVSIGAVTVGLNVDKLPK